MMSPRRVRFSSATSDWASVVTASHRATARSPRGVRGMTGPKKLRSCSVPGANVMIGVPTSAPVRESASADSARSSASWESSSTASACAGSSPASLRQSAAKARASAAASSRALVDVDLGADGGVGRGQRVVALGPPDGVEHSHQAQRRHVALPVALDVLAGAVLVDELEGDEAPAHVVVARRTGRW